MSHEHHYPNGYRDDEELYVYDQCCDNCCNPNCPMELPIAYEERINGREYDPDAYDPKKEEEKLAGTGVSRREDAIIRDNEPTWCIYWKGRPGCH